jgi:hypothetical protein
MTTFRAISFWYNESFLAPFFLKNYEAMDSVHIIIDSDTDDDSREIIDRWPNTTREEFTFPEHKMNTSLKQRLVQRAYEMSETDWVLLVDSDEFILLEDLKHLKNSDADVFYAMLYQVYRHKNDEDLDPDRPPIYQRRHGDPNVTTGINALYKKPCIARSGLDINWTEGCHFMHTSIGLKAGNTFIRGAHWAMADPCFCVDRRVGRKIRRSRYNIDHNMSWHWEATKEQLTRQCAQHLNDPEVF